MIKFNNSRQNNIKILDIPETDIHITHQIHVIQIMLIMLT